MMSLRKRLALCAVVGTSLSGAVGCNMVPVQQYRQAQYHSLHMHQQNQALLGDRDQAIGQAQAEAARNAQLQSALATANKRLANLSDERSRLKQQVVGLIDKAKTSPSPLGNDATRRFEELQKKYPEFEFDPNTGVSKFHSDILFSSGSSQLKPRGAKLLKEFADIMNQGGAGRLNILVVGHTDDRRIAKSTTRNQHPSNWHLSTNRANSVVLQLAQFGVKEKRMGAAGYSKYQPVTGNKDVESRQKNRRVEIFVLAPEGVVAGWDPLWSRR